MCCVSSCNICTVNIFQKHSDVHVPVIIFNYFFAIVHYRDRSPVVRRDRDGGDRSRSRERRDRGNSDVGAGAAAAAAGSRDAGRERRDRSRDR